MLIQGYVYSCHSFEGCARERRTEENNQEVILPPVNNDRHIRIRVPSTDNYVAETLLQPTYLYNDETEHYQNALNKDGKDDKEIMFQ